MPDERIGEVFDQIARAEAATVAFVEGAAFGAGFELCCTCDFRVGASSATFSIPPARLGIVYAPKGIRRVATVVGLGPARSLFLSDRRVSAADAARLGLIDELADEKRALDFAGELCGRAPQWASLAPAQVPVESQQ